MDLALQLSITFTSSDFLGHTNVLYYSKYFKKNAASDVSETVH